MFYLTYYIHVQSSEVLLAEKWEKLSRKLIPTILGHKQELSSNQYEG